jgi:hypothetical protein
MAPEFREPELPPAPPPHVGRGRLIGEHHVVDVATEALVDACLDWAGEDRDQRQQVLTVLNRATRVEHGAKASRAEAQLGRLVRTRAAALGGDFIKVALETPGRLLDLFDEYCLALANNALSALSLN